MKCPVDQIDMDDVTHEDIHYLECPKCHGIWLRHRELREIVGHVNPKAVGSLPRSYEISGHSTKIDSNAVYQCPHDGINMYEHKYGTVTIDICPNCDGIWFDPGELMKIENELKSGVVPDHFYEVFIQDLVEFWTNVYKGMKVKSSASE